MIDGFVAASAPAHQQPAGAVPSRALFVGHFRPICEQPLAYQEPVTALAYDMDPVHRMLREACGRLKALPRLIRHRHGAQRHALAC
jgi:hypothetical protein